MKRLITLIAVISIIGIGTVNAQEEPENRDMEVLELKIQLAKERMDRLQAQFAITQQEYQKLMAEYRAKTEKVEGQNE